jgi:hypothetical protein
MKPLFGPPLVSLLQLVLAPGLLGLLGIFPLLFCVQSAPPRRVVTRDYTVLDQQSDVVIVIRA